MILRPLPLPPQQSPAKLGTMPAWKAFLEHERSIEAPPFAIVLQAEHSMLAGALAASLLDETFGELPAEVITAATHHDSGWSAADELQLANRELARLRAFPELSTSEMLPSWRESIRRGGEQSPLIEILVSRHFTTLGLGDPSRTEFVEEEIARRQRLEEELGASRSDLQRWTAAIGFCDLLSLYLCCGSEKTVEFPLAHPADPAAGHAAKTTLSWHNGCPCFSSAVLQPGTHVAIDGHRFDGAAGELEELRLAWTFC